MTFNELQEKYKSHKAVCSVCGKSLETSNGPLGQYFVMDKEGKFYCTDCDIDFEDGDDRIFNPDEEFSDNCTLKEILDEISGILDFAYESSEDKEEQDYICKLEDKLYKFLRKEGYDI